LLLCSNISVVEIALPTKIPEELDVVTVPSKGAVV
jgi:hypothetical protein